MWSVKGTLHLLEKAAIFNGPWLKIFSAKNSYSHQYIIRRFVFESITGKIQRLLSGFTALDNAKRPCLTSGQRRVWMKIEFNG
jgi:hypothetical protein